MIFIESGIAIVYLPLIRRLAPRAQVIYLASDALGAIGQAETIKRAFRSHAGLVDGARLPSPLLRAEIPAGIPTFFIPHGVEKERFAAIGPSPYAAQSRNAVSVGSMLFDPEFFSIAGPMFPDVNFHAIGSGYRKSPSANVFYHPEMPFEETLPFIKHANFAIAPYGAGVEPYLTHTSMKLMQYGYLGVPAVCPDLIAGHGLNRFGYRVGDPESIGAAVRLALGARPYQARDVLDWSDVTNQLVSPIIHNAHALA